jgi:hypothetical protein
VHGLGEHNSPETSTNICVENFRTTSVSALLRRKNEAGCGDGDLSETGSCNQQGLKDSGMSYSLVILRRRLEALESLPSARKPLRIIGGLPADWAARSPGQKPSNSLAKQQTDSIGPASTHSEPEQG